jgi:hypothetical protein
MPMRGELAAPIARITDEAWDRDAWLVIAFCAVGLILSLWLAATSDPSLLSLQYGAF